MKNKFLQVCLGISAVLISASLLVYSISPAKAGTSDKMPAPQSFMDGGGASKIGKYSLTYVYEAPSKDANGTYTAASYECIILDTETGKTATYYYDINKAVWIKELANQQLPANPMQ